MTRAIIGAAAAPRVVDVMVRAIISTATTPLVVRVMIRGIIRPTPASLIVGVVIRRVIETAADGHRRAARLFRCPAAIVVGLDVDPAAAVMIFRAAVVMPMAGVIDAAAGQQLTAFHRLDHRVAGRLGLHPGRGLL